MKCKNCCKELTEDAYCDDCFTVQHIILNKTFKRKVTKKFNGNRVCFRCKKTEQQFSKEGIKLTIHHKDPDGNRYDVDAVELLCRECHDLVDFGFVRPKKI